MRGVPCRLRRGGGGKEERSLGVWALGKRIKQIEEKEGGEAERLDETESGQRRRRKKHLTSSLKGKKAQTSLYSLHSGDAQIGLLVGFLPFTNKQEINIDVFFMIPEKIQPSLKKAASQQLKYN